MRPIRAEELTRLNSEQQPYVIQVGDELQIDLEIRKYRKGDESWEYRFEIGDQLEIRLMPDPFNTKYLIEVGDVLDIEFLPNQEMNVTRTVRSDGMISLPLLGDVKAEGLTPGQLRENLKTLHDTAGTTAGQPVITVSVNQVNFALLERMGGKTTVWPDGAIGLPILSKGIPVAGLTQSEAAAAIREECTAVLRNPPLVSVNLVSPPDQARSHVDGIYRVDPDGKIGIPGVGHVQVAGYSVDDITTQLAAAFGQVLFNHIDFSVSLAKTTGANIYVGGEVNVPGVYSLTSCSTALQAVVAAGWAKNTGRMRNVIVLRRNPDKGLSLFKMDLRGVLAKGLTEDDLLLRRLDVVYVPKKAISRVGQFVDEYIDQIVPFSNSLGVSATYFVNPQELNSRSGNLNLNTGSTGITGLIK